MMLKAFALNHFETESFQVIFLLCASFRYAFRVTLLKLPLQGVHMKTIHVTPHPDGWQVKKGGAQKASKVCSTQQECIEIATAQARREKAELFVHNRKGRIRERNSYGNDPFPPSG